MCEGRGAASAQGPRFLATHASLSRLRFCCRCYCYCDDGVSHSHRHSRSPPSHARTCTREKREKQNQSRLPVLAIRLVLQPRLTSSRSAAETGPRMRDSDSRSPLKRKNREPVSQFLASEPSKPSRFQLLAPEERARTTLTAALDPLPLLH